ncbi:hypothetical protein HPP92_010948 [Vanilla planifolia]|uniref:Apoptotic chromatin condensation inducer in the nucleus n=1 Tax=Vanilla planifolia TaxID=51239 RepID=A0A835R1W3_VANPL|nr:hypothetical protein HPP92_010948 [Vanilla planifolia]
MEEQGARKNLDFGGQEMDVNHLTEMQVTNSYTTTSDKDFCHNHMSVTKEVVVEHSTLEVSDTLNASYMELPRKESIVEAGSPEKLNLDRSPGDELVEEDMLERKHVEEDIKFEVSIDTMNGNRADLKFEERTAYHATNKFSPEVNVTDVEYGEPVVPIEKRKLEESEAGGSNGAFKRQRRWNLDTIKVSQEQAPHLSSSTTPKKNVKPTVHRTLSQSNSIQSVGSSNERTVPTSRKPASTSLRIDNFLRPFTLKAVQELLSNTGRVCDFWMDHIKTHCYVTYSTVEEAIETRNAIYNLQWPPNGGRLLAAEFVDSQEVKARLNSPLQPPPPISGHPLSPKTAPYQQTQVPEPTPLHGLRQRSLPSAPPLAQLTPPPPLDRPMAREHLPSPPQKPEPPLVTLDDLFKKTKATPRIYYLPLSERQVASKLAAQGMNL